MRRSFPALIALGTLLGLTASAEQRPSSSASLLLSNLPDEDGLAELLWEHSADFADDRARVAASRADHQRTHLLPNPELDVSMNTIPLGATNPPGLRRLTDVPNYVVGLSELVELGKRGPRQDAAKAALSATTLDVHAALRARTYDVLERAADVASTEVRIAELTKLAEDARKLTDLQRARQQHGDAAGLDVDRSTLEAQTLETSLGEEQAKLTDALLACAQLAGIPCEPFGSHERAMSFLQARLDKAPAPAAIEARPDLRALSAQEESARSSLKLARRRWIPDPTVRAGYTRDQFVIAGNQQNSLFVGMSIPLPFFDHGQADAHAASVSAQSARTAREQLTAQAERETATLNQQLRTVQERRQKLHTQTLPLAQGVVQRLDAAVKAGGAALQDLLLARRTYGELVLHAADLDQTAYHLTIAIARASAAGPRAPDTLTAPRS
ncbi:TolC family protein [Corallococcus sp. EGB]|uniref:TolC family protein n=1 Tax=Corallococcus sp. EGB TaxID=1521117 RepID=UPI001CC09507|nr:TolC family protein [Corallococcus sp. EGB]